MRANSHANPVTSKTPATDEFTRLMWLGYEDCRKRRPFAKGFDRWSEADQINYEAGRRAAAVLRPYFPGGKLPKWPKDAEFPAILPATMPQASIDAFLIENDLTARGKPPT